MAVLNFSRNSRHANAVQKADKSIILPQTDFINTTNEKGLYQWISTF